MDALVTLGFLAAMALGTWTGIALVIGLLFLFAFVAFGLARR